MNTFFKYIWLTSCLSLSTALHAATLFQDDFQTSNGAWSQFNGSFSLAGGAYSITGTTDGRTVAFPGNTAWQDYVFEVDANLVAANVNEGFDLLFHVQDISSGTDNGHYYQFTARPGGNATLYKINSPGAGTVLLASGSNPTYSLNSWHHLRLEIQGQTGIAYFDSVPFLNYNSFSDYTYGGIGLKAYGGDTVLYDNVLVSSSVANTESVALLSSAFAWWTGNNSGEELFTGIQGTPMNGAGYADGLVGSAFSFNGSGQYVSVPDSDQWNLGSGDFTIELWARFNTDLNGRDAIFIGHDDGGGWQNKWFFGRYTGNLLFHINSPSIGPRFFPLVNFLPTPQQWYHLAVTRQGNFYTIFVNGSPAGTAADFEAIPNPSVPLTIGHAEGIGYVNGQLDEITLYHRALSPGEIRSIFLSGSSGKHNSFRFVAPDVITAQTNVSVSLQLQATNGSPPYHWSLSESRLPNGMTLSDSGLLQGTPTETGEFRFGISVNDSTNAVAGGYATIRIPIPAIPYSAPPDIVAWWPLEDAPASTTLADRVGSNTAAKANDPTNTLGKVGQALHFNGVDQYLSVQNSAAFQFATNDFSFETWGRFDAPGGGSMGEPSHILIGSSDGPGAANKWFFALGGGVLNFHINGSGGSAFYPLGSFVPNVGEWYHLAVVREGNTFRSYVNGSTNGFATNIINVPVTTAPVTIGQSEFIGLFNGAIDEPTVYRRALRAEEVKAIFNAGTAGKTVDLSIKPAFGGTNGTVTVHLDGVGFKPGATVTLIRPGQTNILGDRVVVATNGMSIDTIFDLHGTTPANCDVVVSNLDGTAFSLLGGFTIQPSSESKVWVDVVGLDLIRPGRAQTFHIFFGNNGNVDAVGVPIWIAGLPTNAVVNLNFEVAAPPSLPNYPATNYTQVPIQINVGQESAVPLFISKIPPGGSRALGFSVTIPNPESFQIRAWANPPYFSSPMSSNVINCIICGVNFIADALIGNECLDLLGQFIVSQHLVAVNYVTGQSQEEAIFSMAQLIHEAVVAAAKCAPSAFSSKVKVTIKIVEGLLKGASAVDCGGACGDAFFETYPPKILSVQTVNSFDPNDQIGPEGVGDLRYLSGREPLHYVVRFENYETATAPAQEVMVRNILDPYKVDINSVQFGDIQIGTNLVAVPKGLNSFSTVLDLRTNQNLIVAIDCHFDPNISTLIWHFRALDPLTMDFPENPLAGFLPPNVTPPEGEGSVSFSVSARDSIATGTTVTNFASIVFDYNPPIDTPIWSNTYDFTTPTVQVQPLQPLQVSDKFELKWGSSDTGSGVDKIMVELSTNNVQFTSYLESTSTVSTVITGQVNSAYWMRLTAWDKVGHSNQTVIATDNSLLTTKIHALGTNYLSWAYQHFGSVADDLSQQSTLWGLSANPNGIGSPNFFKWYYNQSPFVADSSSNRVSVYLQNTAPVFRMVRRKNEPGVILDVMWTPELTQPWSVLAIPPQSATNQIDSIFESIAWPCSLQTTNQGFYRLRLSLNPTW